MNGKLYLVSLPIGNLKDITLRALEVFREVGYVAAEDTREIGSFFAKHELPKPRWISYRDQNHDRAVPQILEILKRGEDVALVSDRGTPTISDPGYKLVRDVIEEDIEVIPIPGPTAAMAALSASGLPTDRFTFLGFLPRSKGKQGELLKQFATLPATFIIYESPFRVTKLLEIIQDVLGEIDVVVAKELTKMHETFIRGKTSEVLDQVKKLPTKGEFVVLGRAN